MQVVLACSELQQSIASFADIPSWRAIGLLDKSFNESLRMQSEARHKEQLVTRLVRQLYDFKPLSMDQRKVIDGVLHKELCVVTEMHLLRSKILHNVISERNTPEEHGDVLEALQTIESFVHDVKTPSTPLWALVDEIVRQCRRQFAHHSNIVFRGTYAQVTGTLYINTRAFYEFMEHGKVLTERISKIIAKAGGVEEYLDQMEKWVPFGFDVLSAHDEAQLEVMLQEATPSQVTPDVVSKMLEKISMYRSDDDVRCMKRLNKGLVDYVKMTRRMFEESRQHEAMLCI